MELLDAVWPLISDWVLTVYQASVRLKHFPAEYKTARVVFLGKPGKKDLAQANAHRPIALLPCLGKGLERLYAKVLSHRALATGLVGTQ